MLFRSQIHCAQLDTGILQEQCAWQMGRYDPPKGPEGQARQHRYPLFMVPVPPHNERLPDEPALLGAKGQYLCDLVLVLMSEYAEK